MKGNAITDDDHCRLLELVILRKANGREKPFLGYFCGIQKYPRLEAKYNVNFHQIV